MKRTRQENLVLAIAPAVPVWAVFDVGDGEVVLEPVHAWGGQVGSPGEGVRFLVPMTLDPDFGVLELASELCNFVSVTADPDPGHAAKRFADRLGTSKERKVAP